MLPAMLRKDSPKAMGELVRSGAVLLTTVGVPKVVEGRLMADVRPGIDGISPRIGLYVLSKKRSP